MEGVIGKVDGKWSLSWRKNNILDLLNFNSGYGVLWYCVMACAVLLFSRNPSEDRLSWIIHLAVFTPSSTRSLDWGYEADNILCLMP